MPMGAWSWSGRDVAAASADVLVGNKTGAAGDRVVADVVIAETKSRVFGVFHSATLSFPNWGFVDILAGIGRTTVKTFSTLILIIVRHVVKHAGWESYKVSRLLFLF